MNFLEQRYLSMMRRYIGQNVIRVEPTENGLYNFTEKIVRLGFITSTKIEVCWDPYSVKRIWIDDPFFDDKWMPVTKVLEDKNEEYASLEGHFVMRHPNSKDRSYTNTFVNRYKMLHATKTHLFLEQSTTSSSKKNQLIIHRDRGVYNGWIIDSKY